MAKDTSLIPGYVSPLTDREHATLGRIAVLWGQIEYFLDGIIPFVSGLKTTELQALGIADKNVGAKVLFLKAAMKRVTDSSTVDQLRAFCQMIDDTKIARNHAFHGVWGWRIQSRAQTVDPCARHSRYPAKPLKIIDLARLEKDLCKCSRVGRNLLDGFWGWDVSGKANRFFHGADDDFPEWLHLWTERNPLRHADLDQSAKAGQLPRLAKHYPRK